MRKKFEATDEKKRQVEKLAGLGLPHTQISVVIGCSRETLEKNFKEELIKGKAVANTKISQTLFEKAIQGNTALLIFWAKTQMGWKEVQGLELTGKDGQPLDDAKQRLLARIPQNDEENGEKDD